MNEADATLLAEARRGDRAALEQLLSRYEGRIFRFGMRMCRNSEDAKDVLQETLLAMTKGVADFRGASSLSTWLFAVARSFCIKSRRKRKHAPAEVESLSQHDERVASAAPAPDQLASDREIERAVAAAISSLEPKYREVLALRDIEGMSAPEVAEVLGVSVDAVKSRLHRARLSVRATLAPLLSSDAAAPAAPGACPDVLTVLSRKIEGDIDTASCADMERHVAQCPRCKGACDTLKQTLALCRSAPAGDVPADVQAAVRNAIRDLARVESPRSAPSTR